jgi:hypothetical protein
MQHLDITVTLDTHDDAAFAAHSLGVAARLAAWPGTACADARTDARTRSFSATYLVTGRRRSPSAIETDLRRLVGSAPSVTGIRVDGRALSGVGLHRDLTAARPSSSDSRMFDTRPTLRLQDAA